MEPASWSSPRPPVSLYSTPLSPPTYETAYAASWIDVTLATPAVVAAGCVWEVREDVTFSEHKYVTVRVGSREAAPCKRLTRYAQAELLMALSRETWFDRVVGSRLGTPEALESVVCAFYRMLNLDRYRRPVRPGRAGNYWWSPELAHERKKVNAMRRRYQRARDESMRFVWRQEYSAALARFRRSIREARDAYERECRSACSRGNVFSKTFREAFGRTRRPRLLPPLERPDGTFTTTPHLESAALLLRSQIAVDEAREDLPEHAAVRSLAEEPYGPDNDDVPFTEAEAPSIACGTRVCCGSFGSEARPETCTIHLLRTFSRDRSVVFISNSGEIEAHPSLGSPQGSPLSPMLWNITIHDFLDLPLPTGVTLQAYADDTVIVVPAQNKEALAELGSRVLGQVIGWAAAARVVVSREKTFCLLFSNGHRGMEKNRPPIRVTSGDRSLAYKDAIRVLGVVFDGRLSFFKHADHLREKAEVTVGKIAALAQMQGGRLRPEQKTSLYCSVFLPGVMYASPVWWDRT
ncbi:hypothetical protein HPB50_008255 [Hyalomma asiaticum]|uniref:Uncharacterized protein n=1 Tax=Hyalomma asiaticum TaxID=266040 RepID=A0ACB7T698_HYAAI|nr:hypothetical protein HPB50_008255 [Hyalomma asiaticum]